MPNITIVPSHASIPRMFADRERTNDEIEQRMRKRSSAAFDVEANQINLRSRNSLREDIVSFNKSRYSRLSVSRVPHIHQLI